MNLFGWCMDNHHEGCKSEFTYENKLVECECDCHGRTKETDVEETQEQDSKLAIPASDEEVQPTPPLGESSA